jgi:TP901 family phage tail tape measure protein
MSEQTIDTIDVRFKGNSESFIDTADRVDKRLELTGAKARQLGKALSVALTAPLALIKATAVSSFASFDGAMTNSLSIMSNVSDQMKNALGQQAVNLSLKNATSASALAESYYFLASAGLSVEESYGALPKVMAFATAGNFGMARATDLLTDAQSALGLATGNTATKMSNMTMLSDMMVKGSQLANSSVEQLSEALTAKAGAGMKSFNIATAEGVAVLAAFADQGIKGNLAGESYNRVLVEMAQRSRENTKEFAAAGIAVWDTSGNMRSMADIIRDMEKAYSHLSPEARDAAMSQLKFGNETLPAIKSLMGSSENLRRYRKELEAAGGATERVAENQMQSLPNAMAVTANYVRAVAIDIGRLLEPKVRSMGASVRYASNLWLELDDSVKATLVNLGMVAALVGPSLIVFGYMPIVLGAVARGYTAVGGAALFAARGMRTAFLAARSAALAAAAVAMANPAVLGVAAAIGAIVAVTALAIRYFKGPGSLAAGWEYVKSKVSEVKELAMGFYENLDQNMTAIHDALKANWDNLGGILKTFMSATINNLGVAVGVAFDLWVAFGGWLVVYLPGIMRDIWEVQIPKLISRGLLFIVGILEPFVVAVGQVFSGIADIAVQAFVSMINIAEGAYSTITTMASEVWAAIKSGDLTAALAAVTDNAAKFLEEHAKEALLDVGLAVVKVGETVTDAYEYVGKRASESFAKGIENKNFLETAQGILNEAGANIQNPFSAIALPEFNFDRKVKEAADNIQGVDMAVGADTAPGKQAINDFKKQAEATPIVMRVGIEAMGSRSAEAAAMARAQYDKARGMLDKAGFSPKKGNEMGAQKTRQEMAPALPHLTEAVMGHKGQAARLTANLGHRGNRLDENIVDMNEQAAKNRIAAANKAGTILTPDTWQREPMTITATAMPSAPVSMVATNGAAPALDGNLTQTLTAVATNGAAPALDGNLTQTLTAVATSAQSQAVAAASTADAAKAMATSANTVTTPTAGTTVGDAASTKTAEDAKFQSEALRLLGIVADNTKVKRDTKSDIQLVPANLRSS